MPPTLLSLLPAMGFWHFITSIFQTLVAMALFFAAVALILSFMRYQVMTRQAEKSTDDDFDPEDAFQINVAKLMGSIHKTPPPFGIAMIALHDPSGLEKKYGAETAREMQDFVQEQIRKILRKSDVVIHYPDGRTGLILPVGREWLWGIATRLVVEMPRIAFKGTDRMAIQLPLCLGASTYPENGNDVRGLIDQAREALDSAMQQGPASIKITAKPTPTETGAAPGAPAGEPEQPEESAKGQAHLLDPLTGVLKPSRVGSTMQKYVARFRRDEMPVSLVYIDVDGLDQYNRHYGRKGGDAILKELGQLLSKQVREEDIIGRVEGEEFVISMACDADNAFKTAQRLAVLIKKTPFSLGTSTLRITVCMGVAGYPEHGVTARQLFHGTERALRAAKARGRNTVVQYHVDMAAELADRHTADSF